MPDATQIRITVDAIDRASRQLQQVRKNVNSLGAAGQTAGAGTKAASTGMVALGKSALPVLAGIAGVTVGLSAVRRGLTGTVGAALDLEDSFAGVRKTMDLTEAEFSKMERANRNLAKSIPVNVNAINNLGEIAGQLGVRGTHNVVKFEKAIATLGITTNLVAEQAAVDFARIASIMQEPIGSIDRMASSVVALGNTTEASEREIVTFATRIAGAGKVARLTTAQVFGIAASFAAVGVGAERGGTAVSKVLFGMRTALAEGGDELKAFTAILGLTEDEFRRMADEDPGALFQRFVARLGAAGDEAVLALEAIGLADQRLVQAFVSLAGAGDKLNTNMATSTEEWRKNTAATLEAEKRFKTARAQIQLAKNNFNDLGITLGRIALPAIVALSKGAVKLAQGLSWMTQNAELAFVALSLLSTPISGPMGLIAAIGMLAWRWEKVFKSLPAPVQGATIAVAKALDLMVDAVVTAINRAAEHVDMFIGGVDKVMGFLSGGKLGIGARIGQLDFSSNIAGALGNLIAPRTLAENMELLRQIDRDLMRQRAQEQAAFRGVDDADWEGLDDLLGKLGDEAGAARTLADALADGIIDLADAMQFGINRQEAATLELQHQAGVFANRLWRSAVEIDKATRELAGDSGVAMRAVVGLHEEEARMAVTTVKLRAELAKLFIIASAGTAALRDGNLLLLQGQVDFAQAARDRNAQFVALQVLLSERGLGGQAAVFRSALVSVGEEFRRSGESVTAFLSRLATAALDFARTRFDALFDKPSREEAQLDLRLAQLRRRRARLLTGGRTEDEMEPLLAPLDREIKAIEQAIALRRAEEDVMRAHAAIADQTLLTDRELLSQAALLVGVIADESALVKDLNIQLGLEELAVIGVTAALNSFAQALRDATVPGGLGAGGRSAATGTLQVNVDVHMQPSDMARAITQAVETTVREQVQRAGFAGSIVSTGLYRPE